MSTEKTPFLKYILFKAHLIWVLAFGLIWMPLVFNAMSGGDMFYAPLMGLLYIAIVITIFIYSVICYRNQ